MTQVELIDSAVRGKMASLRRLLRARLAGEGAAWLLLAMVAVVFVTLGLDWLLRLERPHRILLMSLALAGIALIAWRRLVAPMRVRMDVESLALLVERRYPSLGDGLISAVQFSRWPSEWSGQVSQAMVRRTARAANELAAGLEFGRLIERRAFRQMLLAAGCAAVLLGGFCLWQSDIMSLWARRNLLFASDAQAPWPQKTYLTVLGASDGRFHVLRGEDLTVTVVAEPHGDAPPQITLHARYPSVGATEERLDASNGGRTYVKTFQAVAEPFEFHVTGGDDRRGRRSPFRVVLIEPPALQSVQFAVAPPAYMNRPTRLYDGSRGMVAAPVGSVLTITALSTKDLRSAEMKLDGEPAGEVRIETVACEDSPAAARRLRATVTLAGQNVAATRLVRFVLTDSQGYTSVRGQQYLLAVQPDKEPGVDAKRQFVGPRISPQAIVPLAVEIKDDCGIASARAVLSVAGRVEPIEPVAIAGIESPVEHFATSPVQELDLEGCSLKVGDVLTIRVEAADIMPRELGGPNVGRSAAVELKVVRPEELKEELIQRQKSLRMELLQALGMQETARAKDAAAASALVGETVPPEVAGLLTDASRLQASVGTQVARAAATLDAIHREMLYNRLASPDESTQLRSLIEPLAGLAGPIAQVAALINAATAVQDVAELRSQLNQIVEIQVDIFKRLEDIIQRMAKLESRQELANQLEILIRWSESLRQAIGGIHEADKGTIFTPASGPGHTEP